MANGSNYHHTSHQTVQKENVCKYVVVVVVNKTAGITSELMQSWLVLVWEVKTSALSKPQGTLAMGALHGHLQQNQE
jgi:hypothetical protein